MPRNAVWGFVFAFLLGAFTLYQVIGGLQARADNTDELNKQQNLRIENLEKQNELLIRVDANVSNLKEQVKDINEKLGERSKK